jgi:hypothetical protein
MTRIKLPPKDKTKERTYEASRNSLKNGSNRARCAAEMPNFEGTGPEVKLEGF